ncbi:hypothetical protein IL252_15745 [Halomicrobium sp. IBSBa]|uniref:hypothetical protein n=1 Tax=Halomicrobium sp. IBSBa TaxID=2778916 RepID=UPI001ABFD989|nr:hypothetical protein [Halomicrobium sp. IBSBa]MBO4249269.1 hypothetical protein [Halomicrobium sp. IBSBa]
MKSVEISVEFDENPVSQGMITGRIQVVADEQILTRRIDEQGEPVTDSTVPDGYVGTRVLFDLLNLTKVVSSLKHGNVGLYEQCRSEFTGERFDLVFERLSDHAVRVCYQDRTTKSKSVEYPAPPAEVALGASVELDKLCDQVITCDEQLLKFAREANLNVEDPPLAAISDIVSELQKLQEDYDGFPQ